MDVTVEVVGEGSREVHLEAGATYADLLGAVGLRVDEASVLVGGTPVAEDREVDADRVQVLRLIRGG
jgi:sulfur carrier protein